MTVATTRLVDVAADDLVAGPRDVGGERQPDLAERDDDDLHQPAAAPAAGRTVSPVAALARTASAYTAASRPSSSETTPRLRVAGQQVEERLELDEQRLAARERVAGGVALADAAQRLGGVPLGRRLAVGEEREVGGERVGDEHPELARARACGGPSSATASRRRC